MLKRMFESDSIKKATKKLERYEKGKQQRIEAEENPKDPRKTFHKILFIGGAAAAFAQEPAREATGAIIGGLGEAIGGRELFTDLPPMPVQVDMSPGPADSDAHIAKLNTDDVPNNGEGR